MARGYIYEVSVKPENVGSLDESSFYEQAGRDFDYVENVSDTGMILEELTDLFKRLEAEVTESEECFSVVFTEKSILKYFTPRYQAFQKKVESLTLSDFMNSTTAYFLCQSVEDSANDVIVLDGEWKTFDEFMRIVTPGTAYFVGSDVVFMH